MTPERWRAVDAILQAALACEPERRDAVVAAACGADAALRMEVESLLSAHVDSDDAFLERPAAGAVLATDLAADLAIQRPDMLPFIDRAGRRPLASAPDDRMPSERAFDNAMAPAHVVPLEGARHEAHAAKVAPHAAPGARTVSARATLYVAAVMLVVGLVGGLVVDRSSFVRRWTDGTAAVVNAASNGRVVAPPAAATGVSLAVVDRAGQLVRAIPASRPWTPRFSPDGHRVAYGAFGNGRESSDLWVTDLDAGTTRRLTDGDADANDPQWSADGASIAYSASAPGGKDVMLSRLGNGDVRVLASRPGTQFPSDWRRDGSALLVTEEAGDKHDILVQPADGSPVVMYAATAADETAARFSPDGHWVAYTSDASGRPEVYLDSYPRRGQRVLVSSGGGAHPVWRGDGRELYYWRDGALMAVQLGAAKGSLPPIRVSQTVLFRAKYDVGVSTMYDVSPDGQRFVIATQP